MLRVSKRHVDEAIAHCRSRYPKEACGLFGGKESRVEAVYLMRNAEDSPISYSMDPREQLQVEKQMRQKGQKLIGIFHSHTASAAYPSSVDVNLALSPDISYVLVSLKDQKNPDFRSFRIDGKAITEEPVQVDA